VVSVNPKRRSLEEIFLEITAEAAKNGSNGNGNARIVVDRETTRGGTR
jgi:hypothetical protein